MKPLGNKIARWIQPDQLDENMSSNRNTRKRSLSTRYLFESDFAFGSLISKSKTLFITLTP